MPRKGRDSAIRSFQNLMLPKERWLCSEGCWAAQQYLTAASGKADKSHILFPTAVLRESPVELDTHYLLSGHPMMMRNLLSSPPLHTTSHEIHRLLC